MSSSAHQHDYGHPCRLYLISPAKIEIETFPSQLEEALSGGDVGAFQLRLKDTSPEDILTAARALLPICKAHEVAFILNDDPEIAGQVGADGVHLGQEDLEKYSIEQARKHIGPDGVVGVSCHDSSHMAMQAGEQGADYVAFGAFHPTTSKEPEKLAKYGTPTLDMLTWWQTYTILPCVAIGGMTPDNCGSMVTAGADFIAAINAVWTHKDGAKQAVADFNHAIKKALEQRPAVDVA